MILISAERLNRMSLCYAWDRADVSGEAVNVSDFITIVTLRYDGKLLC